MTCRLADLSVVRAKLGRAYEHLDVLDDEITRKYANALFLPFEIRNEQNGFTIIAPPIPKMPERWSLILGDALQNLRATLNYLVWQLVHRDGHEPSGVNEFPFAKTENEFIDNVKARKKTPDKSPLYGIEIDGDAWAILEEAQPYKRADPVIDDLEVLRQFSNIDKHHTLHVGMHFPDREEIVKLLDFNGPGRLGFTRLALSHENPTPVLRVIFDNPARASMNMKPEFPVKPTFGGAFKIGSESGFLQAGHGRFRLIAARIEEIINAIGRLPRVV